MKPWDNEPRIRQIRIDDDDGVPLPNAGGQRGRNDRSLRRPWMPLAVSGIAITGLVTAVAMSGAVNFRNVPAVAPDAFTPTTAVHDSTASTADAGPTLEDMIPNIADRLTLLTTDGRTIWNLMWDPSFATPKTSVVATSGAMAWAAASFDAGGQLTAGLGTLNDGDRTRSARIGSPTSMETSSGLQGAWELQWHATDVARFAMVRAVGDSYTLETTEVDFLTKAPRSSNVVHVLDEPPRIVRWDDDGFILQLGNRTIALDARGNMLWSADGWAHTASPGFVPQTRQTDEGVRWYLIDRESGSATSFSEFGISNNALTTEILTSKSSNIFAAASERNDALAITVGGFSLITPKTVYIFEDVSLYQFTPDASFVILTASNSNDLTFFDWRAGTFHKLDVPGNNDVLAVNVG